VTRRAASRQVRGGVRVKKEKKKTESLATVTSLVQSIFDSMFQGQIDEKGSVLKKRRCGICEVEMLPPLLLLLLLFFFCFLLFNGRIKFLKTIPNRMVFCIRCVKQCAVSVFQFFQFPQWKPIGHCCSQFYTGWMPTEQHQSNEFIADHLKSEKCLLNWFVRKDKSNYVCVCLYFVSPFCHPSISHCLYLSLIGYWVSN